MKLTERLKVEHGVFLLQLKHLEELLKQKAPAETLRATVDAIAAAEERHTQIEDRLLYRALEELVGKEAPALQETNAEHRAIRGLADKIRAGEGALGDIHTYVETLRAHLEREIHGIFALAEECIGAERLTSMCRWEEEHVFQEAGKGEEWLRKLP